MDPRRRPRSGWERFAWLPVPLLLAAIIAASAAGLRESYENEALRLVLSFTFYTLVSLGTLFLIGRSFLSSGLPGLLLLECGVVLWSLAGTVGDIVSHGDANIDVTIFNTGILLAGLCHLAGAVLSLRPQRSLSARPLWLGVGCALALGSLWLVTWMTLAGWLPVFFIPGQGGTMVRTWVLISATAMFVLSAVLLRAGPRVANSPFASWYSLALLLLAVGLFGIMIQLFLWSAVNWLSRTAQWLSGFYLLLAAVAAIRESHLPLLPLGEKSRPALYRDVMAVVMVLAAAALRLVFLSGLGTHAPFLVFYPTVILAALYGGLRAGLLATALSAILADYFWIEPTGQLAAEQPADWLGLVIFLLTGGMVAWVINALLRARARVFAAETQVLLAAQREAAAEAVQESEERLRAQRDRMPIGCIVYDERNCFSQLNPAAERIFGYSEAELRGRHANVIVPEATRPHVDGILRRLAEGDMTAHSVNENVTKDGSAIICQWTNTPLRDAKGAFVGFLSMVQDVTDRKRAEEALRESEERLRLLGDNLPDSAVYQYVHECDGSARFVHISAGIERLNGVSVADVLGDAGALHRQIPTEYIERLVEAEASSQRDLSDFDMELPMRRPDGDVRWMRLHSRPRRLPDGRTVWDGVQTDVTESKRAVEALRLSEEKFAVAFANNPAAIALTRLDNGVFLEVNDTWLAMNGYCREEVIGHSARDFPIWPTPEDRTRFVQELREKGPLHGREQEFLRRSGDVFVAQLSAQILTVRDEQVVLSTLVEITEQKRAEAALHESKEKLTLALRSANMGVWRLDLRDQERHFDDQVCRCLGIDPARFAGTEDEFFVAVHPDDHHQLRTALAQTITTGAPYEVEYCSVWPDGSVRYISARGQLARDAVGQPQWIDGLVWDITDRKQAEDRIRVSLAEKEVLLKEIHHRVKNNMQVISSLVALQAERVPDAATREVLRDVTHRVRSMALVHEKLYQSANMAQVEFAEYAESLLNYLWRAHGTTAFGVRLSLDLEPVQISVNAAVPCGLVLNELASNALKHAFHGRGHRGEAVVGGQVSVSLRGGPEGRVCLRVRDNGTGLPAGLDWRQADSLGLRLVQMLAGQLDATVEVCSGQGTEFTVMFGGPKGPRTNKLDKLIGPKEA